MSFNSWDKLAKAQRDYPKIKAAVPFVEKQLKRNANNPFLQAWKADLALQRNSNPQEITTLLVNLCRQSGITDVPLLSYLYRLQFEARQRSANHESPEQKSSVQNSNGQDALKCWQAAAKTLQRPNDRLALWNALFGEAVQVGAWEDARLAIMNYSKDGPPNKKHYQFLLALTSRLTVNRKKNSEAREVLILRTMALQYVKKSFTAAEDDPIAMKDIRDLRFMADMLAQDNNCQELFDLWKNPPVHLVALFKRHRDDILAMMTRVARDSKNWALLERHCIEVIDEKVSESVEQGQSQSKIWELCAWNVEIWDALILAVKATQSPEEGINAIKGQLEKIFSSSLIASDRPLRLTNMKLRQAAGESLLPNCKDYFEHHAKLPSCFEDLRPFVGALSLEDGRDFVKALESHMEERYSGSIKTLAVDEREKWLQSQLHLLKFQYLFEASSAVGSDRAVTNALLRASLNLAQAWPENSDTGYLVIYAVLGLHYSVSNRVSDGAAFMTEQSSRYLLQAAMYARHVVEKDKEKHNRTMALLAARLHLNLGLGTIGLRLFGHTKCKEMLLDTLSPYVLARISQTHPFASSSYKITSADEELGRVIGTMERMEKKTDDFLVKDVPSFHWDSAIQSLQLKHKLQSSLTRHLCIFERRRMARLRGDPVDNLPRATTQSYTDISDNWDQTVFPSFESQPEKFLHLNLIMPNGPPNKEMFIEQHFTHERVNELLYREIEYTDIEPAGDPSRSSHSEPDHNSQPWTRTERRLRPLWANIETLLHQIYAPEKASAEDVSTATDLLSAMTIQSEALPTMSPSTNATQPAADEPTLFHENMLMASYGILELCRGVSKLLERLRDDVLQPKTKSSKAAHPLKNALPKNYVTDLTKITQSCYQGVRDVAQSYVELLGKRGVKAVVVQVRAGETGEALRDVLGDDDVEFYAREYVDSAVEAWKGVLKVKLK